MRVLSAMVLIIALVSAAQAQENQGRQDPTEARHIAAVQIGAGTDDETTTGSSGPQKKPDANAKPGPCDDFRGAVKRACLETVTGQHHQETTP